MISEDAAVVTAALLALAAETRMASGNDTDLRSARDAVEKNWEHFDAVLTVYYDLGETRKRAPSMTCVE